MDGKSTGGRNIRLEPLEGRVLLSGATLTWKTEASMPVGKAEGAAFVADGKLYTFGGFDDIQLDITTELDAYNPATNNWTREANCPVKVNDCPVTVDPLTDIAWMGGFFINNGFDATGLVYKYNIKTNVWTQGPSLPVNVGAGGMAVVGRTLYYWGGRNAQNVGQTNMWKLNLDDPSAGWSAGTPMLMTANHLASAVQSGKIYSIGGIVNKEETTSNETQVQVFDPSTNKWTFAAPLPFGLGHIASSATVAGDNIVLAGGELNAPTQTFSNAVLEFSSLTNTWTRLTNLPDYRASAFTGYINGQLVVTGGNMYQSPFNATTTWVANFTPTGAPPTTSVSGTVFNDANSNGKQDTTETGLAGITIYSDENNNGKLDPNEPSTVTNAQGDYLLTSLPTGPTIIRQILPTGSKQTYPTLAYGQHITVGTSTITAENFGDIPLATSVSGIVFNDLNANGTIDPGEPGLAGWTVFVDQANMGNFVSGDPSTTTDANGDFSFDDLSPGNYILRAIPPTGWHQTYPTNNFGQHITLTPAAPLTGLRFGEQKS